MALVPWRRRPSNEEEFMLEFNSSFRASEVQSLANILSAFEKSSFVAAGETVLQHLSDTVNTIQWVVVYGSNFSSWTHNLLYDIALSAKLGKNTLLIIKGSSMTGKVLPLKEDGTTRALFTMRLAQPLEGIHLDGMRRTVADISAVRYTHVAERIYEYFQETFGSHLHSIVVAGKNLRVSRSLENGFERSLFYFTEADNVGVLVVLVDPSSV
ncbi:hypothetical protein BIW11_13193 [Tropilaelaps mercedesae]|uniref:Uncharacterized protein n=1 Tax=Tropilaelaps mercedesae TaxID=418985 RepID=A0A1V9X3C4_9ACAR|nr:hypothetical protein BIW11_13193 [Tropilaelaps mercedesae]